VSIRLTRVGDFLDLFDFWQADACAEQEYSKYGNTWGMAHGVA
jgi:hypothetical protein